MSELTQATWPQGNPVVDSTLRLKTSRFWPEVAAKRPGHLLKL